MDTRETALLLFVEMEKTKNFGSSLIRDTLNKYDYEDPREKAFLKRLTEGTLESLLTLDYVINAYSKTPTNKMKPLIRSLLRLSVYQICIWTPCRILRHATKPCVWQRKRALSGCPVL